MCKIFYNSKPIILTTEVKKETNFKNFLLSDVSIDNIVEALSKSKYKEVRLIHHSQKNSLKTFLNKAPVVVAGGGKVYNDNNDILFIYRNDKWDLPKGKAEGSETIEETAVREVEEETGVSGVQIKSPLKVTYHLFKRNGKIKIKETHWFEMYTDYTGTLVPQLNESITKVKWLKEKQVKKALKNSYSNIKLLF